ncbi:MAG: hypothetical protein WA110_09320 [Anaerolineaceae bacterium]
MKTEPEYSLRYLRRVVIRVSVKILLSLLTRLKISNRANFPKHGPLILPAVTPA